MKPAEMREPDIDLVWAAVGRDIPRNRAQVLAHAIIAARDKQWQELLGEPVGYTNPNWVNFKGNGTIVKKPCRHWTQPVYAAPKETP